MSVFFQGIIEGFYGRQWSWRQRCDYAGFLAAIHCQYYIYAPKADAYLRSRWRELLPGEHFQQLQAMAKCYRQAGVGWGLGLSPAGLFADYRSADKLQLQNKLQQINQLEPDVLCILFDDMPGEFPKLAHNQLKIITDIVALSNAKRFIVCPSYYSFDPLLELVFGVMPKNYLEDLGRELPTEIDVFWTGDKVISDVVDAESLLKAEQLLQRKPVLWDNLFANDGKKTADFLALAAIKGRDDTLLSSAAGVMINPMNQPHLARLAVQAYQSKLHNGCGDLLEHCDDSHLRHLLQRDCQLFSQRGLANLSADLTRQLLVDYETIQHPVAEDVQAWLTGLYRFDPSCLTG